jgi:hypothetical protein
MLCVINGASNCCRVLGAISILTLFTVRLRVDMLFVPMVLFPRLLAGTVEPSAYSAYPQVQRTVDTCPSCPIKLRTLPGC